MPRNTRVKHTQGYGLDNKTPLLPKIGISNTSRKAWNRRAEKCICVVKENSGGGGGGGGGTNLTFTHFYASMGNAPAVGGFHEFSIAQDLSAQYDGATTVTINSVSYNVNVFTIAVGGGTTIFVIYTDDANDGQGGATSSYGGNHGVTGITQNTFTGNSFS